MFYVLFLIHRRFYIQKSHQHNIAANITVVFMQQDGLNLNKFFNWCTDKYEMDGKGEFSISFSL